MNCSFFKFLLWISWCTDHTPCRNAVYFKYTFKQLEKHTLFVLKAYFKYTKRSIYLKYNTFGHLKSILQAYFMWSILQVYFMWSILQVYFMWSILQVYFVYTLSILCALLFKYTSWLKMLNMGYWCIIILTAFWPWNNVKNL